MPQIVINTHRSPRFVNVGEDPRIIPHRGWIGHRQWEGNRHYGFVSAGQGTVYSNPFRNLEIGDVVFAFISGEGYVGVGVVNQRAVPIRNFKFGGLTLRDLDVDDRIITAQEVSYDFVPQLTSIRKTLFRNANNDELTDYAVGVEWKRTVPIIDKFGEQLLRFWDEMENEERDQLLTEILDYANSSPSSFRREMSQIRFNETYDPLPIVAEALVKQAQNWGDFFVETIQAIFAEAKRSTKPKNILELVYEFTLMEDSEHPFVQRLVDILHNESQSEHLESRLAAISRLPPFLENKTVRNSSKIKKSLQHMLSDNNWKVRYVTYHSLKLDNMLPPNTKLRIQDKLRAIILGEPKMY